MSAEANPLIVGEIILDSGVMAVKSGERVVAMTCQLSRVSYKRRAYRWVRVRCYGRLHAENSAAVILHLTFKRNVLNGVGNNSRHPSEGV